MSKDKRQAEGACSALPERLLLSEPPRVLPLLLGRQTDRQTIEEDEEKKDRKRETSSGETRGRHPHEARKKNKFKSQLATVAASTAAGTVAACGILQLQDLLPGLAGKGAHQTGILPRPRTACLSQRIPRCDPLHDNRAPEGVERISPAQLSPADCPPAHFPIPPHTLVSRRQPFDPLAPEPRLRRAALDVGIGARKIAQV
ncbi:hypothetical protein TRV_02808 [Trichophyton verrucosum HKI 0517]|uniref:Uncharacterized protein n=1 Tax=Trichophyton verrucosum (strain HKI 0517) TaxID=663202 RepID=D4D6T1_TRIVH|nr:uncharacterized protein TRV_02808 [Trichophyton verrucosum HKI 0517]EFE42443.1 hypothetical protein TRV_02808 [Trichophyton verrucosum HKI 0517]